MLLRTIIFLIALIAFQNLALAADETPLLAHAPTLNRTDIVFVYGG